MARTTGFPPDMVAAVMIRDGERCCICGKRADTANHRANRGAGGHRGSNRPSNAAAICHLCNGLIEAHPEAQAKAVARGAKISRYHDPEDVPYLSPLFQLYVWLHDDWTLDFLTPEEVDAWLDGLQEGAAPLRETAPGTGSFDLERGKEFQ